MKRINKKTSKRIAAIILAAFAACSVMGCSVEKTVTVTETHTESVSTETSNAQTSDTEASDTETTNTEVEPAEVEETEEVIENPGYFETDSWSISYDTDKFYGYISDEGNTVINYVGECAGTSLIEITEVDIATAKEAVAMLEEKKGKELTVIENVFDGPEYTCFAYAADEIYEPGLYIADFYTIYEHNEKVIIIDEAITHDDDDARAEALAEEFVQVKNTLELK